MPGNGNKTRPVRTLTVKNFSVIKEAKLEFGKITVLIGPQASGKSLLCRLAYFFGQIVPEAVNGLALLRESEEELFEVIAHEFKERFPLQTWGHEKGEITFSSELFTIGLSISLKGAKFAAKINREFLDKFREWVKLHGAEGSAKHVTKAPRTGTVAAAGPFQFNESVYIPAGRAFFSTPNRGFASMSRSGKNLDWIAQRFPNEIDWEYRAMLEPSVPSSDLLPQFYEDAVGILGGRVVRVGGHLFFSSLKDDRHLPFHWLSSGTQELLPLLNPLSNLVYTSSTNPMNLWEPFSPQIGPIFIEEPELSVFPSTQYDLMRLFAWLAGEERLKFPFVITTHSPYVLSSFNNLIYAGQLGQDRRLKKKIKIEERYWVEPGTFRAYSIHDGKSESILSDSGLIDGNYLDSVSETIGNEFDELLRLEYGKKKAS
jgi:putative AbiEii toxin of type IV toxin-antitoxin system